ncbi:hypothetical protein TrCOL_g13842 [Triparma columacea]|nr:hypothetical protein TrCOL_g13842 [Triparma columacea]
MSNIHCEREALINHTITISEFDPNHYESGSDAPLRIYLEQPSPLWKTFSLEKITFVGSVSGGRRRSSQTKSSSSAWPPVGSAGASLMRNVSHLNSPARGDDLWSTTTTNTSSPYSSDQQSSLPGSALDRLSRAISVQMSIIRSTDILGKSQASTFLAVDSDSGEPADSENNVKTQAGPVPTNPRRSSSARGWR